MERVILSEAEISAQLDTEFTDKDYSELKKVYSIWICMNSPDYIGNAISEYGIAKRDIVPGIPDVAEDYDKLSVVVICLNRKVKDKEVNELIGMLNTVFDTKLSAAAKKQILNEEYGMTVDKKVEEVMGHMCNLGEGIYENGVREGREEGRFLQLVEWIRSILMNGRDVEDMAALMNMDIEFVRMIAGWITENANITDTELMERYQKNIIE